MKAPVANPQARLILAVDDEPIILRSVTAALAMAGLRVMIAENGIAGLEAFLHAADEIDLVLTDVVMPVMDGIAMVQAIRSRRPDVPVLLMTAYSDSVIGEVFSAKFPLIRKPFLPEDLVRTVNAYLEPRSTSA
jgi:two-component system cell cycle sensor histidine kinase/response regulator CckA